MRTHALIDQPLVDTAMDQHVTFSTWLAKRDELRRRLAARQARWDHSGPLRPAPGSVVSRVGVAETVAARQAFLRVAGEVAPALLVELAGAPLDEYAATWDALGGPTTAEAAVGRPLEGSLLGEFAEAVLTEPTDTGEWLATWGFPVGDWHTLGAPDAADPDELLRRAATGGWGLLMAAWTLHRWRAGPLRSADAPGLVDVFPRWAGLGDADMGLDAPLALPVPRWDPQREERGAAAERILGELRAAVRTELDRIATEARRVGPPPRRKRTGLEHLAWLARYQFRHESYPTIARDACRERQSVAEGVRSAAGLVGLPLRQSDRPGRPRKAPDASGTAWVVTADAHSAPRPVRTLTPSVGDEYRPAVPIGIDRVEPAVS